MAAEGPSAVPAPVGHLALLLVGLAPLFVTVDANFNIVITAALTVFVGCWRSVKPEPPADAMTKKDAIRFPVVGSAVLFSLFLMFKFLPKDLVNLVLSAYFVSLGCLAITATLDPIVVPRMPARLNAARIEFTVPRIPLLMNEALDVSFTLSEALLGIASAAFCAWYWAGGKHWAASNALGLAFSLQGIEHLSLGTVANGAILLAGLFVYDVFWVFCTPVMVHVARSFDAPIKLLFPRGGKGDAMSMLGLGDIVIPGVFVALMLRYDVAHARRTAYFRSAFTGYVAGLGATIVVMNVFKAAQPALLYIVPALLGTVAAHAAYRGEFGSVLHWHEHDHHEAAQAALKDKEGREGQAGVAGEDADAAGARATRSAARAAKKDS